MDGLREIAAVPGSAVGGSFGKVQGLDLSHCRSLESGIGNWYMELANVRGETSAEGRTAVVRMGGHHRESECKSGSDMYFVECRSC